MLSEIDFVFFTRWKWLLLTKYRFWQHDSANFATRKSIYRGFTTRVLRSGNRFVEFYDPRNRLVTLTGNLRSGNRFVELYRTTRSVNVWGCKTRLIDFLKRLFAFYDQNSIRRVLRPQKSTSRVLQPKKSTSRVLRSKYRSVAFYGIARRIEFRIAKRDQSTRPVDFWGRKMRQINSESPVRFYEARNRLVAFYDPGFDSSRFRNPEIDWPCCTIRKSTPRAPP